MSVETPVAYDERPVRRTRKPHKCCECRCEIPAGSACWVGRGIWVSAPRVYYWCLGCELLRREVLAIIPRDEEPLAFGELHEFVWECR